MGFRAHYRFGGNHDAERLVQENVISYLSELRINWRPLLGATFGLVRLCAFALPTSIIAPHMIADLGWSRADYALLGTLSIVPTFFPVRTTRRSGRREANRADRHHCAAAELSRLLADDRGGLAIHRHLPSRGHLGITTTNTVYSRVAVQYSETARGWRLPSWRPGPQ